ncbi:MAG: 16S rRNA (cytidine(1402)-2'-O)-methyltransferase [candidate division Zixibacteria bacterium]|nr:16S rRNA (cytidine(1402)-2'-O)-methyltransferase [candidate division Zixibacteria bacterium]
MVSESQKGILFLVATPIGNMGDITLRAIDILKTVNIIAAEDTRVTGKLLKLYGIDSNMRSFHKYNENTQKKRLIQELLDGKHVALVSDAGSPGISDPAYSIVHDAIDSGIEVQSIPGASSVISALTVSGLPMDKFFFAGFPPYKKGAKKRFIEAMSGRSETIVLFESPHRLINTLEMLKEVLGDRRCVICRELTKRFEEKIRGSLSEIVLNKDDLTVKGEFVLVIEGKRD